MAANICRVIIDANGGLFYFEGEEYGFYDSECSVLLVVFKKRAR